jgi:fumarate reductase flavoprotein subunit
MAAGAGAALMGATAMAGTTGCTLQVKGSVSTQAADGQRVFIGSAPGLKSDISVMVSLDDQGAIESVRVTGQDDTPFIVDAAINQTCAAMVERQSLAVDTVSGATWSSKGIIDAAKSAVADLPHASDYLKEAIPTLKPGDDIACDVLVIGGGAAGLSASIAARGAGLSMGDTSGLSVVLVEQLAYTGGCIRVSDTVLMAFNNTPFNKAVGGAQGTTEAYLDLARKQDKEGHLNEQVYRSIIEHSPQAVSELLERGLYMPVSDARIDDVLGISTAYWAVRNPLTGTDKGARFVYRNDGGPYLAQSLEGIAIDCGVDIRKSTKVEELVLEDGTISAVEVTDRAQGMSYLIKPKKVILATGCLGANTERAKHYSPAVGEAIHFGCAGTTGDGVAWVEQNGGVVLPGATHFVGGPDNRIGHYGPVNILDTYAPCIKVNLKGERFFAESIPSTKGPKLYLKQPGNKAFGIMSGKAIEEFKAELAFMEHHGAAWKADTLDDLAKATGIDAEGLAKTVEAYNTAYEAGKDADFEMPHAQMTPVAKTGPYYAFLMRSLYNLTDVSVKVNADLQPIKQADGAPVFKNAYAAGSFMVGNYAFMWGGFSHMTALTSGHYVGKKVASDLKAAKKV